MLSNEQVEELLECLLALRLKNSPKRITPAMIKVWQMGVEHHDYKLIMDTLAMSIAECWYKQFPSPGEFSRGCYDHEAEIRDIQKYLQEEEEKRKVVNLPVKQDDVKGSQAQTESRPWGEYTVLDIGDGFQIKRIEVLPQQRLSYQKHQYRSEHWYIVQGKALVVLNEKEIDLSPGQAIDIPQGARHRICNSSEEESLIFVEVQRGSYLGEDDIVRFSDDYGREFTEAQNTQSPY